MSVRKHTSRRDFLEMPAAADQCDPSGAGQFEDPVGTNRFDESLDLLLLSRDLDHELLGTDVEAPPATAGEGPSATRGRR